MSNPKFIEIDGKLVLWRDHFSTAASLLAPSCRARRRQDHAPVARQRPGLQGINVLMLWGDAELK
jgi:hypothetical protein